METSSNREKERVMRREKGTVEKEMLYLDENEFSCDAKGGVPK